MSRRPAKVTQDELARAIRAAKQECGDGWSVRVLPDGTIEIAQKSVDAPQPKIVPKLRAVL